VLAGFLLQILTFLSACEGAGGDIHGVQHDLHRALRVPQAVTTAWFATPPRPQTGGSVKLLFPSTGHLRIHSDLILYSFSKTLAHSPFPLPCTYILANSIQDTLCFSIALSMTVYNEPYDSGQRVKSVPLQIQRHTVVISLPSCLPLCLSSLVCSLLSNILESCSVPGQSSP
jgi:hypothetical protein